MAEWLAVSVNSPSPLHSPQQPTDSLTTGTSACTIGVMKLTTDFLKALPKVLLHDHLDGGLRPQTIVELARESGYQQLPAEEPDNLAEWFHTTASRGSLPLYLQGFEHTI